VGLEFIIRASKWYPIALLLTVPRPQLLNVPLFSIRETSWQVLPPWKNYEFETHMREESTPERVSRNIFQRFLFVREYGKNTLESRDLKYFFEVFL